MSYELSYSRLGVVTTKTLGFMLPRTACPACLQAQQSRFGGANAARMCTRQAPALRSLLSHAIL